MRIGISLAQCGRLARPAAVSAAARAAEQLGYSSGRHRARRDRPGQGAGRAVRPQDLLVDLIWFEWSALATSCRGEEAEALALRLKDMTADDPRPQVRAVGHQVYAVLCWGRGRIRRGRRALRRRPRTPLPGADALRPVRDRAPPRHQHVLALAPRRLRRPAARGGLRPLRRHDPGVPDRFAVASICGFAATAAITLGCWDQVAHFVDIGASADASSQFAFWSGQFLMQSGIVQARGGEVDEGMAVVASARGDRDRAGALLDQAAAVATAQGAHALAARAAAVAGDLRVTTPARRTTSSGA